MPDTISDAPLMLSVSGARGIVGRSMTPTVAAEFAAAFGAHLAERGAGPGPLVCLGRDSRPSGPMLAAAAQAGLAAAGCAVIDVGLAATPSVGVMIGALGADGALVVTASHNPAPWNGLKCLLAGGIAPPPEEAAAIIDRYRRRDLRYVDVEHLQPAGRDGRAAETHVAAVLGQVRPEAIRDGGFRVVLDAVNGAGGPAATRLLESLGCEVVGLNLEPSGRFAHEPEPLEANLGQLARATAEAGAAAGFALDPDADRLAIVDEQGRCIGEEYTLALAARRMLQVHGPGVVVANLSTSRMIDDVAAAAGAEVVRTAVGEANVAATMRARGALVGGEGNGGVIVPPVCYVRDSLVAMGLVLDGLAAEQRPLGAIVDDLPAYAMIKRKLDLAEVGGATAVDAILARVAARFTGERISTVDGVRIDFADGWVHLRPSNTEPIVRIIAEAATAERAAALADEVVRVGAEVSSR